MNGIGSFFSCCCYLPDHDGDVRSRANSTQNPSNIASNPETDSASGAAVFVTQPSSSQIAPAETVKNEDLSKTFQTFQTNPADQIPEPLPVPETPTYDSDNESVESN